MLYLERPLALSVLSLVPAYLILKSLGFFSRNDFSLTLGDWGGSPFRWNSAATRLARAIGAFSAVASFGLVAFALSGPVKIRREPVYSAPDATVIFVLDASPSMAARDMESETRLEAGKRCIADLVSRRPGTAFGLAGLGSTAALLVPPTMDHRLFLDRLASLSVGEFGDGTALGLGLAVAAAHRSSSSLSRDYVVLVTDGENNAGEIHPETAASLIRSRGSGFFVIGIGSRGTVPVDYVDPETGTRYSGLLESDFNEGALRAIALSGEGVYASARDARSLELVFASIDTSVPALSPSWTRTVEEPLSHFLAIAALALFAVAWIARRVALGAIL